MCVCVCVSINSDRRNATYRLALSVCGYSYTYVGKRWRIFLCPSVRPSVSVCSKLYVRCA